MYTLGKYLMKQGFIIGIMADKDVVEHDYFVSRFKEEGFRIFVMPIPGKGYKLNNIPRSFTTLIRFFKIINRYKPDLIHVHWRVTSFYDHLAYKFLGIPYIVTLHSVGIPSNFLARKLSFWGQYAIAISKETYLDLKYKYLRFLKVKLRLYITVLMIVIFIHLILMKKERLDKNWVFRRMIMWFV